MKIFSKEDLIEKLKEIRKRGWICNARPGNDGGVGNTLEDLLGIDENNLPIPNAAEWELKAQKTNTTSLITLMHMEPSPKALKFVPNTLLPIYGWKHQEAGGKYPESEMSFRQTIKTTITSDRGFTVNVNRQEEKIEVLFDENQINERHDEWKRNLKKKGGGQLNPSPYWGFDDLFYKVASKLHNCFFVEAQTKRENGKYFFKYDGIYMLKGVSRDNFIKNIEDGAIYVDFDARTGHNHGTKFRMKKACMKNMYEVVKKY